jgi:very-short-patch-repair endonuclease
MLCSYRCGQESIKQFENGKYCCSEKTASCPGMKRIQSKSMKGKNLGPQTEKHKKKRSNSMKGKNKKPHTEEQNRNHSKTMTGRTKENNKGKRIQAEKLTGRTKETHEGVKRQAEKVTGRTKENDESVKRSAEKRKGIKPSKKCIEVNKQRMLSEEGNRIRKQIKNPSKQEVKLREIVKKLFPTSEHTFSILNYNVDVALPEYKIAIEYDGWYHFDSEEHKEYHNKRQKEIEQEGWKFVRYDIFHPFPTLEQTKQDIQNLISCENY